MDELLAKATHGVDLSAPGAAWQVMLNLLAMVPWVQLLLWNLVFIAVGAALGWYRRRVLEGVLWAAVLGPLGWIVIWLRPRRNGSPPA